jgi:CRISPR/Cas system-associated endoribonuclease Cas2
MSGTLIQKSVFLNCLAKEALLVPLKHSAAKAEAATKAAIRLYEAVRAASAAEMEDIEADTAARKQPVLLEGLCCFNVWLKNVLLTGEAEPGPACNVSGHARLVLGLS